MFRTRVGRSRMAPIPPQGVHLLVAVMHLKKSPCTLSSFERSVLLNFLLHQTIETTANLGQILEDPAPNVPLHGQNIDMAFLYFPSRCLRQSNFLFRKTPRYLIHSSYGIAELFITILSKDLVLYRLVKMSGTV